MKQTMHNTRVRWVLGILIALTLAFIWSNSMQSRAVSGGMSGSLKTWLEQLPTAKDVLEIDAMQTYTRTIFNRFIPFFR